MADYRGLGTGVAPDGVGKLEADGEGAGFRGACAEGVLVVKTVAGCGAFYVWRNVAAHVEALHFGGGFEARGLWLVEGGRFDAERDG